MPGLQFRLNQSQPERSTSRRLGSMCLMLTASLALIQLGQAGSGSGPGASPGRGGVSSIDPPAWGTLVLESDADPRRAGPVPPPGLILAAHQPPTPPEVPSKPELPKKPSTADTGAAPSKKNDPDGVVPSFDQAASSATDAEDGPLSEADLEFLLQSVEDQRRDISPALYYYFLDKARKQSLEQLIADGRDDVSFASLYRDPRTSPARYRGQLVTISGVARRIEKAEVAPNPYGITQRYELWVFSEDSGKFPWVVVTTELPEGLKTGATVDERVTVAGYFLQLWAYRASDGFRTAPLLLGRSVLWKPQASLSELTSPLQSYLAGFVGLFVVVILAVVAWIAVTDLRAKRLLRDRLPSGAGELGMVLPERISLSEDAPPAAESPDGEGEATPSPTPNRTHTHTPPQAPTGSSGSS